VTALGVVDRAAMLAASRRLAGRADDTSRAVAAALSRTARGRLSPEEREWTRRVDGLGRNVFSMHSSVAPLWGRFLFALVRELRPDACIELGTNLGVSGAYQAAALELNGSGRLMTFEGNPEWADRARLLFERLELTRVDQRVGLLEDTLEPELARIGTLDYAYVDADHSEQANRRYLEAMLPHLRPGSVLAYDDIGLSGDMRRSWEMVRDHERISAAAAAHRMGVAIASG
jgi:predicted O-methyltransferase YrrM